MRFLRPYSFLGLLVSLIWSPAVLIACIQAPGNGGVSDSTNNVSHDPNMMEGPLGYGDADTQRFVFADEWLNYKIHFENMTNATASACEIRVTAALSDNLDWSTFEFSEVCLGSQTDTSFFGKKGGEDIVSLQDASYKLKMVFSVDEATGALSCYLRAWDESQADQSYWPADVLAGILPPNDDTGRGEGYIAYRVKVKNSAASLARVDSAATIVFDSNAPIATDPAWWNLVAPVVTVSFNVADGVALTNALVLYGESYGTLPVPTREGYTFGGWWTGIDGSGAEVTNDAAMTSTTNLTLYAKWTINSFTLTYAADTNGTVQGALVQRVDYGASGTAVEAVANTGYHFMGWSDGRTDNPRVDTNVVSDVSITALFNGVAFEADEIEAPETVGVVTLSVLGGATNTISAVGYWILPGTAAAGTDYAVPKTQPQRLAWTNEVGERTISIPIKTDAAVEDAETFYVLLGSPTNCAIGEPKVCKVTITDANNSLTLAEALDNALLPWTTGGAAKWTAQTNATYDGVDAAMSGTLASNKLSYVQTSVKGTGTLSFAWSVAGKGILRLYDGKVVLAAVTNATTWETRTLRLTQNAAHALKWEFADLGGTNSFAYLDQVAWVPGGAAGVTVTVSAEPSDGGTASGTGTYYAGAKVPLAATAKPGWLFAGWTPTNLFAKPATAAQTLTVGSTPISAVANFTKVPIVTGLPNPPEGGVVTGSGLCPPGKSVTLRAVSAAKWAFTCWSDGSQSATRTISATTNVTLYAGFKPISQIPSPTLSNPGAQSAMVGVAYTLALSVVSESLPTVTAAGLPAGLALDTASFSIAGIPSKAVTNQTVTVTAKNAGGTVSQSFPMTVSTLDMRAQGTFTGVASGESNQADVVRGLLSASVTAQGVFSAKVTAQSGAVSFTGKSWDSASNGVFRATLKTAKGETLSLAQDAASAWNAVGLTGALTGGAFSNAALSVSGQRNPMSAKTSADYAAGTNALSRYRGYYTVALPPDGALETPGSAGNVPLGSGYLALTVKDGGAVALAGKLADGTALSGSSTLVLVADGGASEAAYVPFLFPLYGAKGVFSGVLEILPGETSPTGNVATAADDFMQAWAYPGVKPTAKPAQTEDRFTLSLAASGGWYNTLGDLRAYYSNAVFAAGDTTVSNTYVSGAYTATVGVVETALPDEALLLDPKTGTLSLSAGKVPVYDKVASNYVYAVTNPAAATFKLTKTTGLFSGTFNLYYEYADQTGALKLKTVSVPHAGVLTPVRAEPDTEPVGQGFYLVPDTWKSSDAKPVAYPLKRSYGVEIHEDD